MPFICVQSTPCSGNPADTPLKADGPAGTGRKLQAGHCPGTSHIGGGSPRKVGGGHQHSAYRAQGTVGDGAVHSGHACPAQTRQMGVS